MKLIVAILRDEDTENVSRALVNASFRVTRIASTGGFLKHGNTTLVIGLDEDKVDTAFDIIRKTCGEPTHPGAKRATLFVLNVANYQQL
jgi:uncharacterized protein YaaQ